MKKYRVFGVGLMMLAVLIGGSVGNVYGQVAYQNFNTLQSLVKEFQSTYPLAGVIEGSDGYLYGTSLVGGGLGGGTVYRINKDGSGYGVVRAFPLSGADGGRLRSAVVEGADGFLYGTTTEGGINNAGIIFKVKKDGSNYTALHQFASVTDNGAVSHASLVVGSNGVLFGTTCAGGSSNQGTIFRINPDGTGYAILHEFTGSNGAGQDGARPSAGLTVATNGVLYGVTENGGDSASGTIFTMNQDGGDYRVIRRFSRTDGGGWRPGAPLVQGKDGMLYGTTVQGDLTSFSEVFKVSLDGSGYAVLKRFDGAAGFSAFPCYSTVTQGGDGNLYVAVSGIQDGTNYNGGIYSLNTDGGNPALLKLFADVSEGSDLESALVVGSDGALYGTAGRGGAMRQGTIFRLNSDGSGFAVLKHLIATGGDAGGSQAPVLLASDGALYGTAYAGASNRGAIFKMNRDGSNYSILKSFGGFDGENPIDSLVEGVDGGLYGTTSVGGSNSCGVIFRMEKDGSSYRILKSFSGAPDAADGARGLTTDGEKVLYGVTTWGGINNYGTIFRINESGGGYTILKSFTGGSQDGGSPEARLLLGNDGALYGTARYGGINGGGMVFKIQRDGSGYTVLKKFDAYGNDGFTPKGALVQDPAGMLYGSCDNGGSYTVNGVLFSQYATVFRMNANGSGFAVIKRFVGSLLDGAHPRGLVQGIDGSLYGTTYQGGSSNLGTIFRLNRDGSSFEVLKSFTGTNGEGSLPMANLTLSGDGTLYGTAGVTVFSLTPAMAMRAPMRTASGLQIRMTTGIPGCTYTLERASSLSGPWAPLAQVTISTSGVADFQDPNPPQGSAFYRAVYP